MLNRTRGELHAFTAIRASSIDRSMYNVERARARAHAFVRVLSFDSNTIFQCTISVYESAFQINSIECEMNNEANEK